MTDSEFPPALEELLANVAADDGVLGVILTGSQARAGMVTADSDTDVFLVVSAEAHERWQGWHSPELDVAVYEVGDLDLPSLPRGDLDSFWNRYAFAHAEVLVDRVGGRVLELVEAQGIFTPEEALELATDYLDGYMNFAIRSLKSFRDGHSLEARLDAVESIPYLLVVVFALENRVRPYNKYLGWELRNFPLANEELNAQLRPLLEDILLTGEASAQRILFALVEAALHHPALREVVESWGDDVEILREPVAE